MKPAFADLEWTERDDGRCHAAATSIWWIYWRTEKEQLKDLGFSCFADGPWFVEFDPRVSEAALLEQLAIIEQAHAVEVAAERKAIAERAERKAEYEADVRLRMELLERKNAEASDSAKARGRACFEEWGQFTEGKPTLVRLLEKEQLNYNDIKAVDKIITATKRKAAFKLLEVEAAPVTAGVDWPEETVDGALRWLTSLDDDWAQIRNGAGWSASSTSLGHWCTAMLDRDPSSRALGIKAGRQLLLGYAAQLHDWLYHQGWDRTLFATKEEADEFARVEARMQGIKDDYDAWLEVVGPMEDEGEAA